MDESPQVDLGLQFGQFARAMRAQGRADPAALVAFVADIIPAASSAGLTLLSPRGAPRTLAATDPLVGEVDALQYSLREGPCLEAIEDDDLVLTGDLRQDQRWLRFGPRCAAECGVQSMLGVRLVLDGPERGALNLYATEQDAFTDADADLAAAIAPMVSLVLQNSLHERRITDLETALTSNRSIGIAVGIMMARQLITAEKAFEQLNRASQHLNRKLRDLAAQVVLTGELPHQPAPDQPAGQP
jgi:GAF domain-containing protein